MINYRVGNLVDVEHGIIAHGCNCQRVMGGGVALAVRTTFPRAYTEYKKSEQKLNNVNLVHITNQLIVANCFTQQSFGAPPTVWADLGAIETCMRKLRDFAHKEGLKIYIPRIGCGLGGLDWSTQVEPMLKLLFSRRDDMLYVIDLPPAKPKGPKSNG